MAEINLLFLAPNWRVSLIRAFRETMSKNTIRGRLVGADSDPNSPAQVEMDSAYTIPPFRSMDCFEKIRAVCIKENVGAVLPLMNLAVEFLDKHRQNFKDFGVLPIVNKSNVVDICHDKLKLARFCEKQNILSPELIENFSGKLLFPLIAKPRRGEGGKGCIKIEDQRDLAYYRAKFPDHIVQKFIQGREFSIDWYSDFNGVPRFIVPRERLTVRAGEVMVSRIESHPSVMEAVQKTGQALNLSGFCTLQGFLNQDGKFFLTDVNLRFGSGSVHAIAGGADAPLFLLKDLLEEKAPLSRPIRNGLVMTRFSDSFYLDPEQ